MREALISSEGPVLGNSTLGLMTGGEETWLRLRLRHRLSAKAAGNSYSLIPTAGRASPRLYAIKLNLKFVALFEPMDRQEQSYT